MFLAAILLLVLLYPSEPSIHQRDRVTFRLYLLEFISYAPHLSLHFYHISILSSDSNPSSTAHSCYLVKQPSLLNIMCDWEEFQFTECSHSSSKLLSYCHFARTDPYHQCFGVKVTKHTWVQHSLCPPCEAAKAAHEAAMANAH